MPFFRKDLNIVKENKFIDISERWLMIWFALLYSVCANNIWNGLGRWMCSKKTVTYSFSIYNFFLTFWLWLVICAIKWNLSSIFSKYTAWNKQKLHFSTNYITSLLFFQFYISEWWIHEKTFLELYRRDSTSMNFVSW